MHLNMQTLLRKSSIRELKGDVTRDDFSATQRYNIVVTLFRMAAILSQHFNPVLRLKSSLRIVPCNNDDNEKLVLRGFYTRRFATTIFSVTQRYNIVATLFRRVATLFQHCNAVLR